MGGFRWNQWNVEYIAEHGVSPEEAEYVVTDSRRPYPRPQGDGKWLVRGQGPEGRYIQVIYVVDAETKHVFVIHARPLTPRERRNYRREYK